MINNIISLSVIGIIPVITSILLYFFDKKAKINYWVKQIIFGIIFGIIAILGTEKGVAIDGAMINARDAAPVSAALIFGAPSGIIAGFIGGIWRWFYTVFRGLGEYTQLACTVSTILAGVFGAILRKLVFEDKRPRWYYALATGIVVEVFHMMMVFVTNMTDIHRAFDVVKQCTIPMITVNALAVLFSVLAVNILSGEFKKNKNSKKKISTVFQTQLLVLVILAFIVTSAFNFFLQSSTANADTAKLLALNISDVKKDIKNDDVSSITNRHIGENGRVLVTDKDCLIVSGIEEYIGKKLDIAEIDVKDKSIYGAKMEANLVGTACYYMCDATDGYYIVAIIPKSDADFAKEISVYVNSFMEVLVYAGLFILVYSLTKSLVVQNVNKVNNSLAKITAGDLDVRVKDFNTEEFSSLSKDINKTVDTLKKYIKEAEERIDEELKFAKTIQHSVLPNISPYYKDKTEFEIFADMHTAKEVGGDFYDFYFTDRDHLVFLIADVSGKGIPAAMFMMTAKTLIKSLVTNGLSVEEAFTEANKKLCEGNDAGMFVTAWIGKINIQTGVLEFVNAGHNPPCIKRKNGEVEFLRTRPGLVLAGMDGVKYRKEEMQLEAGDKILLYTDGVTEANNINKELYGEERLLSTLRSIDAYSMEDVCIAIKNSIDEFKGEAEQFDDITMLALLYKGK